MDLKVLPVIQVAIIAIIMLTTSTFYPNLKINLPAAFLVSIAIFSVALVVAITAVLAFKRHNTTVNPTKPESSSQIVNSGIFAISRNPMYLAMLLSLVALAYYLGHLAGLPLLMVFVLYMTRFQIQPEERMLEKLFGQPYLDYKQQVRRWL